MTITYASPRVRFVQREILLDRHDPISVELSKTARVPDISLVIDIYNLDSQTHPEGHLGWWKFAIAAADEVTTLSVDIANGVTLNAQAHVDHWINPDYAMGGGFVVSAVLRAEATNAILSIDRVPAVADAKACTKLRSAVRGDAPADHFLPTNFLPDSRETIHLVCPNIFARDAVGNFCIDIYNMLRAGNFRVRMHASNTDLAMSNIVEPVQWLDDAVRPADQVLYFYSTHDPYLPQMQHLNCRRKIAYYHGVTDPAKLRVFDPEASVRNTRALAALDQVATFDRFAANSRFSATVLAAALPENQRQHIAIIPPKLLPLSLAPAAPAGQRQNALLCVSTLNPHKKIEDVLRLFAAYRAIDNDAECWIVGKGQNPFYQDYLSQVETAELGLPKGCVRWFGSVGEAELQRLYQAAGFLVSMSEDEGFCLPLWEAMHHQLPVVAHHLPAVEETLGAAGLRFFEKDFAHIAAAIAAIRGDAHRYAAYAQAGAQRAKTVQQRMHGHAVLQLLTPEPMASES